MKINPYGKVPRRTSFTQQLRFMKRPPVSDQQSKLSQHFRLIMSVLDLLMNKNPRITDQILVLKKSIIKWQEHSQEQIISKNRQLLHMRDNIIVNVKQEIGIVFEEVGQYLKALTEEYRDENIRLYYLKYLRALKKIQWQRKTVQTINQQIQTQFNQFQMFKSLPTEGSLNDKTDSSSIEGAFTAKKYKQIDLHKYILLKQQNLQLQRKIDKLGTRINELQLLNKNLTQQIDRLTEANYAYRSNKEEYLYEIQKLGAILNRMKEQQNQRLLKAQEQSLSLSYSEALLKQSRLLKIQSLYTANEEQKAKQEELLQMQKTQKQFNRNYINTRNTYEFETVKKQKKQEAEDDSNKNVELRLLFMQANVIQSFFIQKANEQVQLLQQGSLQLDFSYTH